jgi:hypothetical protein
MPRPLKSHSCDTFQLSKIRFKAHCYRLASNDKEVRQLLNLQNKKRGLPLLVAAPFLKSVCYSKAVR